jgi:hypothetical protein
MIRHLIRKLDLLAAFAMAAIVGRYLSPDVFKDATGELITFFGIQAAVILPAMIFTASILRPDGLTLSEADRYHRALRGQMIFWIVLLALDFLSVISLIVGKLSGWSIVIYLPRSWGIFDASWIFTAIFAFLASLAVLRIIPFVRGVLSLLDLNSELTKNAIKQRNKRALQEEGRAAAAAPFKKPEGYGKTVTRPEV